MTVEEIRLVEGKQIGVALIPYNNQTEEDIKKLLGTNLRHATRAESNGYIEQIFEYSDKHGSVDFFDKTINVSLCVPPRFLKEKDNTENVCFIAKTGQEKEWIAAGFWDEIEETGIEDYLGVIVALEQNHN